MEQSTLAEADAPAELLQRLRNDIDNELERKQDLLEIMQDSGQALMIERW